MPNAILLFIVGFILINILNGSQAQEIPSEFVDNRVVVTPVLPDGKTLRFYTDTGGGWNALSRDIVTSYGWPIETIKGDNGSTFDLVKMPKWMDGKAIPDAGRNNVLNNRLIVAPSAAIAGGQGGLDGFLGGRWHAEKIIEWDYFEKLMVLHTDFDAVEKSNMAPIDAPVRKNVDGNYELSFPRIEIEVDDVVHQVLFDTGATMNVSATTQSIMKTDGRLVGSSFMIASVFDQWRENHPDWRYIEDGDYSFETPVPIIQVPKVSVAGLEVGPVWFARRPDNSFLKGMAPFMDQPIVGAVGGSLFQYFRIIMDYPSEKAYFEVK
ncbi:hypothetical protein [Kordiimonas sp. SCSIO 12610]|uniref:hypothetical protein n=1 Tax=Kordiimonas sp. SCSIO 12610 TaxID=2829597 RepID=UPI00210E57A0|nr:hypothetical protein [Kordiimonas sp. SCSIO 12610]UTW56381.1 hypothetical protein KFF44_05615 [Kordiimonas sp. SCSIO 12610]